MTLKETKYLGETNKSGEKEGLGIMVYKNGGIYEGEWENDMAKGVGRLIHADGDTMRLKILTCSKKFLTFCDIKIRIDKNNY
jgi:hypothetical protein